MMEYCKQLFCTVYPYVRMTQRGKYVNERAMAYLAWKAEFQQLLKTDAEQYPLFPPKTPLTVSIIIHEPHPHTRDLDNEVKAVMDACNGIVWADDRWVDTLLASRHIGEPRVFIVVRECGGVSR